MFFSFSVFQFLSLPELSLRGNWVDLIIIIIFIYFILSALRLGFWSVLIDFFSFLSAILTSLFFYRFASYLFRANFSISHSFSNVLGFLLTGILAAAFFGWVFTLLARKVPVKFVKFRGNIALAVFPALGEGLIVVAFALTLALGFPMPGRVKEDISDSKLGGLIVKNTSGLNSKINDIFGRAIQDSLSYLTVNPQSREAVSIASGELNLSPDRDSEVEMFNLVNEVRRRQNLGTLSWSDEVAEVSRKYASDLWERSYFGHYSPEGGNVGNRLDDAGVTYTAAGENLAMAPTVMVAHVGLMNSEGHRKNILDPLFGKIGIGVVDNGLYGKIFVQVFTD